MIVILDTNAFRQDVFVEGQGLTTLFRACADQQLAGAEVWTPRGVLEELVRQFPERLTRLKKDLRKLDYELSSFRLRPALPAFDAEGVAEYRTALEARLQGPYREIADHPADSQRIIDWAAQRRHPIKPHLSPPSGKPDGGDGDEGSGGRPVFGVVDAAIWLTVISAAKVDDVALISNNKNDFCDEGDATKPHPLLVADLKAAGCDPGKLSIFPRISDFNDRFVTPVQEAQDAANAFLGDTTLEPVLREQVEEAVRWIPISQPEDNWGVDVEVDELTIGEFEAEGPLILVRADPAEDGFYMTVEVSGTARVDLGIRKSLLAEVDQAPVTVLDYDWNESMLLAEAYVSIHVLAEVRVAIKPPTQDGEDPEYDTEVSVEGVFPG
jgi:hypothetical protein